MDIFRRFASEAPSPTPYQETKPTLLVCWWCTFYALTIILFRLVGRYLRAEKVFIEDGIMMFAIIPLLLRMGFTHLVLVKGTNNVDITGLLEEEIKSRVLGSQMVLVSRIFYATLEVKPNSPIHPQEKKDL